MATLAQLKAVLQYQVDYSGLRQFERSLKQTQQRINSSSGLTGSFKKATQAQSDFYKQVTRGVARTKPSMDDLQRNLVKIREGYKRNMLTDREYRDARLRTLNAISQLEKKNHLERMRRIRAEQKAQGPFAGGRDPRQRGTHGLISALHSDVAIASLFGGFAAMGSVQSFQQFVAMEQGLTAATGSMERASEEMEYLIGLSRKLGVFVGDMGNSFSQFAASAAHTSLTSQEVRDIFEGVASQARVLNLSAADTQGVFRALNQVMSKGTVMSEDFKNQMAERMAGAMQAGARAAKELGITTEATVPAFRKAMEEGKLISEEFLPEFSRQLLESAKQGGALEKAMNNTGAAIGRFRTNVFLANKTFNEAGFDKGVRNLFNTMSDFIMKSDALWNMLGSTAGFLANALRAPFEVLTDLSQMLGVVNEKAEEFNLTTNQTAALFLTLFKLGRRLLAIFVLLPYTLSAISRAWNEGGIGNWSIAIGAAVTSAILFRKQLMSIGRVAKRVSGDVRGALGQERASTVSQTAQESARRVTSPWEQARTRTFWERASGALREGMKGATGRLPVFGFGAGSTMSENEFLQRSQEVPWWNLTGRLEAAQREENRQMIVQGDIKFEITGDNAEEISDEVIRVINSEFIRPSSAQNPVTER